MRISDWSSDVCSSDLRPQSLARRAEARHQLAEGDRADARRTDQAQAVEPLLLAHSPVGAFFEAPTFGSVPLRRRAIFSRCRHSTISASASATGTRSIRPKHHMATGALTAAAMPPPDDNRKRVV